MIYIAEIYIIFFSEGRGDRKEMDGKRKREDGSGRYDWRTLHERLFSEDGTTVTSQRMLRAVSASDASTQPVAARLRDYIHEEFTHLFRYGIETERLSLLTHVVYTNCSVMELRMDMYTLLWGRLLSQLLSFPAPQSVCQDTNAAMRLAWMNTYAQGTRDALRTLLLCNKRSFGDGRAQFSPSLLKYLIHAFIWPALVAEEIRAFPGRCKTLCRVFHHLHPSWVYAQSSRGHFTWKLPVLGNTWVEGVQPSEIPAQVASVATRIHRRAGQGPMAATFYGAPIPLQLPQK